MVLSLHRVLHRLQLCQHCWEFSRTPHHGINFFYSAHSAIYIPQNNFHWRVVVSNVVSGYFSSSLEIWSWYHSFAAGKRHPSAHRFQRRSAPTAHFCSWASSVILVPLRDIKSSGSRWSVVLIFREFKTPRAYSSEVGKVSGVYFNYQ